MQWFLDDIHDFRKNCNRSTIELKYEQEAYKRWFSDGSAEWIKIAKEMYEKSILWVSVIKIPEWCIFIPDNQP